MKKIFFAMMAIAMCACGSASHDAPQATIAKYYGDKKAAISFTYDDGTECHYTDIAPQLEKRGFRGTFWLIGQSIGTDNPGYPFMSWEQVAELDARGHEISNHTWTHPDLTKLTTAEVQREIELCDSAIAAAIGRRPITFCYPFNAMSDSVVALASEGRVGTRTFWVGQGQVESHCTDESLAAWVDDVIAKGDWAVTMTHALSYGWDQWEDPTVLWRLYDNVKAHEADIWVGTFAQVAAYEQEREHTSLTVEKAGDGWIVTPTTDLDPALYNQPLTMVLTGIKGDVAATQGAAPLEITHSGDSLLINFLPAEGPIAIK